MEIKFKLVKMEMYQKETSSWFWEEGNSLDEMLNGCQEFRKKEWERKKKERWRETVCVWEREGSQA